MATIKAGEASAEPLSHAAWGRRDDIHEGALAILRSLEGETRVGVFHGIQGIGVRLTGQREPKDGARFSLTHMQRSGKLVVKGADGSRDPFVFSLKETGAE